MMLNFQRFTKSYKTSNSDRAIPCPPSISPPVDDVSTGRSPGDDDFGFAICDDYHPIRIYWGLSVLSKILLITNYNTLYNIHQYTIPYHNPQIATLHFYLGIVYLWAKPSSPLQSYLAKLDDVLQQKGSCSSKQIEVPPQKIGVLFFLMVLLC